MFDKELNLGSHNSWSYLHSKKWWMRPFEFMSRCQRLSIEEQLGLGIRLFDLRIFPVLDGLALKCLEVRHGFMSYKIDMDGLRKDLELINKYSIENDVDIYVRIILEQPRKKKSEEQSYIDISFSNLCRLFIAENQNIKFFGFIRKFDWSVVLPGNSPELCDRYSSTTSLFKSNSKFLRICDDWWPWLYAKLRNQRNYNDYIINGDLDSWLFIDFVDLIDYDN